MLTPKCKNAIFWKNKQFRAIVSVEDLQEVVPGLFKEPLLDFQNPRWRRSAILDFYAKYNNAIFSETNQFRATVSLDDL